MYSSIQQLLNGLPQNVLVSVCLHLVDKYHVNKNDIEEALKPSELERHQLDISERNGTAPTCMIVQSSQDHVENAQLQQEALQYNLPVKRTQTINDGETKLQQSKKKKKPALNVKECNRRHIAIKLLYDGEHYSGLAIQLHTKETIEEKIFDVLQRTKLIFGGSKECFWAKCGRTDAGVSSFGQVVSLFIRSTLPLGSSNVYPPYNENETYANYVRPNIQDKIKSLESSQIPQPPPVNTQLTQIDPHYDELDYIQILNGTLPPSIRALAWTDMPNNFNVRFSCDFRVYRYFFCKGNLDIDAMIHAAHLFKDNDLTPQYELAREQPLCLWDCQFQPLQFVRSKHHIKRILQELSVQASYLAVKLVMIYEQMRNMWEGDCSDILDDESEIDEEINTEQMKNNEKHDRKQRRKGKVLFQPFYQYNDVELPSLVEKTELRNTENYSRVLEIASVTEGQPAFDGCVVDEIDSVSVVSASFVSLELWLLFDYLERTDESDEMEDVDENESLVGVFLNGVKNECAAENRLLNCGFYCYLGVFDCIGDINTF
ncbi:MAG: hypothetical protein EZS28_003648 [Streblomastix strix]|uniref:tRNA pseudouridine synthase n=1 Tax=Streblomastix strix TaxID=222440 RepID=A0A5J4X0J4_9EUKA|nr:MAG: hypothetical protein EZS28_003648 [Streblomastix strix]